MRSARTLRVQAHGHEVSAAAVDDPVGDRTYVAAVEPPADTIADEAQLRRDTDVPCPVRSRTAQLRSLRNPGWRRRFPAPCHSTMPDAAVARPRRSNTANLMLDEPQFSTRISPCSRRPERAMVTSIRSSSLRAVRATSPRCAGMSAVSSSSDSARRVAAIGDELGARKEAASFRQQKRHGMGDFVRCTQTTDRMQVNGLLEGRFIQEIQDGRPHVTGMNRIDPDSLGRIGQSLPSGSARSRRVWLRRTLGSLRRRPPPGWRRR